MRMRALRILGEELAPISRNLIDKCRSHESITTNHQNGAPKCRVVYIANTPTRLSVAAKFVVTLTDLICGFASITPLAFADGVFSAGAPAGPEAVVAAAAAATARAVASRLICGPALSTL